MITIWRFCPLPPQSGLFTRLLSKMEEPRAVSCAGFYWSPTAYLQEPPTGGAVTKAPSKRKNLILLTSPRTIQDEPSSGPDLAFRAQNGGLGQKRPFCGGWGVRGMGLWGRGRI